MTPAAVGAVSGPLVPVLSGVRLEHIRAAYPEASVSRVVPNTAVEIRRAGSLLAAGGDEPEAVAERFGRLGCVVTLPGSAMPAATNATRSGS